MVVLLFLATQLIAKLVKRFYESITLNNTLLLFDSFVKATVIIAHRRKLLFNLNENTKPVRLSIYIQYTRWHHLPQVIKHKRVADNIFDILNLFH